MSVHLIKLCVGVESPEELAREQAEKMAQARAHGSAAPGPWHITRRYPRRDGELLDGGSLYWVICGTIRVRQKLIAVEPVTDSQGRAACCLSLDPTHVPVMPRARRPFQGWRYLEAADAPADLNARETAQDADMPAWMRAELADLGLL